MDASQYCRNDLDSFLSLVANNAAQRPVGHTYLMTSDIAWQFPDCAEARRVQLPPSYPFYIDLNSMDEWAAAIKDPPFHSSMEERVALHRAAWAPASGFNMDRYLKVRGIDQVFDPELDIVAIASDGTFASYATAWKDPVSLIGSFEPFGTHPDYRGTGVSRAVIGEGFRRMIVKGMRFARIYTAGFNHQAAKLYQSCGFTQVDVNRTLIKRI